MATNFERQGFVSVLGGMNGSITPSLLADTQYAYGSNVCSRKGLLKTRPRWQRVVAYIPSGQFQGCFIYESRYGTYLAVVVSGTLYLIDLTTYARLNCGTFPIKGFDRAYFCQVDRFLVVQNGIVSPVECWPIIMDGELVLNNGSVQVLYTAVEGGTAAWTRLRNYPRYDAVRVPIGTHMIYGHGRLFVVTSRLWDNGLLSGNAQWLPVTSDTYFVAGDIVQPDNVDEVLAFTETDYLAEGGAFSLPVGAGKIMALQFFRNAATGTGAGELVVFGERGVSAFAVNSPRDQWAAIALAQVLFTDAGACAANAVTQVNGDLMFRAADGLRTIAYTHANAIVSSGSLSNLPQSAEITDILDADTNLTRAWASMIWVENRFLPTVYGLIDSDVYNPHYFRGLAPLDTYVVGSTGPSSTLVARSTPAYNGVWNGLNILQMTKLPGDEYDVAAAVCRINTLGRLELWEFDADVTYDGAETRPLCRVQTRTYDFEKPMDPKEFKYAEVWVSNLRGQVDFTLYFRPDNYSLWTQTNSITVQACETGDAQQRWCLRFAISPDDKCYDLVTNRDTKRGFTFEFMLEWRGVATIEKAGFYALIQPSSSPNLGCSAESCQVLQASDSTGLTLDLMEYTIPAQTSLVDPGEYTAITRPEGAPIIWMDSSTGDYTIVNGDAGNIEPYVWSSEGALLSGGSYMVAGGVAEYTNGGIRTSKDMVINPVIGPDMTIDPFLETTYPWDEDSTLFTSGSSISGANEVISNTRPAATTPTPPAMLPASYPRIMVFPGVTGATTVTRGTVFSVPIAQYVYTTTISSSGSASTVCAPGPWPGSVGTSVTLSLTTSSGDTVTPASQTVTWSDTGTATLTNVKVAGGTGDRIAATLLVGVAFDGALRQGEGALLIKREAVITGTVVPAAVTLTFQAAVTSTQTQAIVLKNTSVTSFSWTATLVDVSPTLGTFISVTPASGAGLAPNASVTITVACAGAFALGTWPATLLINATTV